MLTQPFHALWTHAGVLVDRTVLDLDILEPGKLYIYESVFSGSLLGFEYSKTLPVDHTVSPGSYHLGPQIRSICESKRGDFCSELVALLYRELGIKAFQEVKPGEMTPVEVEAMPAFGGRCLVVKRDGKVVLEEDGRTILTSRQYTISTVITTLEHVNYWSTFTDSNIPSLPPIGHDLDGTPLYICRARIGQGIIPGFKRIDGILSIPWDTVNVTLTYPHEMLTSLDGMTWHPCSMDTIPETAVLGGRDEEGRPLFVEGVVVGNVRRGEEAVVPVKGKVRRVKVFEVLVFEENCGEEGGGWGGGDVEMGMVVGSSVSDVLRDVEEVKASDARDVEEVKVVGASLSDVLHDIKEVKVSTDVPSNMEPPESAITPPRNVEQVKVTVTHTVDPPPITQSLQLAPKV
ncbi:hypothetical protein BC829DRAFT_416308 [Chytridium lagenaria]|nr:hypothetical protein BC829DRAFT_416308 [Chytridium lagenaria]